MKILLLGNFSGNGDEGLSQVSNRIYELLKDNLEVKCINTMEFYKIVTFFKILKYRPRIVHYITGPTLRSFIILSFLKTLLLGKTKTVISATRPFIPPKYFFLLKFFHVDLVLTQSFKWERIFEYYGFRTSFMPNPINAAKFNRSNLSTDELKLKYNIPSDCKILLHVGHIRHNRNMNFYLNEKEDVEKLGYKILIVSSTHFEKDEFLLKELVNAGIIVITDYLENINEIYSLADYFVFPIKGLESNYYPQSLEEIGVIDMPLSILEALAIGIPVISTEIDSIITLYLKINLECPITFWDGTKSDFLEILKVKDILKYNNSVFREEIDQYGIREKIKVIYLDLLNTL